MSRNWKELGIRWETSVVMRQHGDHASDRRPLGNAQIPVLEDPDLAIKNGLGPAILKGVNGTSWRVMAQDVSRNKLEDGIKDADVIQEDVFKRLLSIRASGGTRVIVKRNLPNGDIYEGSDETEFRQMFAAALVDLGIDAETATEKATKATF